jgi:hypothetical protein
MNTTTTTPQRRQETGLESIDPTFNQDLALIIAEQRRYEMPLEMKIKASELIAKFDAGYNNLYPSRQPLTSEFKKDLESMLVGLGYGQQRVAGKSAWVRPRKDTLDVDVLMPHEQDYFRYHTLSEKEYQTHFGGRNRSAPRVSISNVAAGTVAGIFGAAMLGAPQALGLDGAATVYMLYGLSIVVTEGDALKILALPYTYTKKLIPDKETIQRKLGIQPFALVKYTGTDALRKALVPAKGFAYE